MAVDLREQLQQALAGAYTIERDLGGGMSHVFVADDSALGRRVVVKVLRAELAEGLSAERFKREMRLAARLQHPHIVPLLAAGVLADGALFYTMPFVEGENLRARLDREGALPLSDATRILRDVASALAYAHRQGIVHRDIKPENVLLSEGGAVVTDFGIAKAVHAARADESGGDGHRSTTLTQQGTSLGTPAYMAPEQAAGGPIDHRADLYSLGVVAYEMLTGHPPFDGRTAQRLLAAHAIEIPEPVERRRPNVPPPLAALVARLLEKEPADRPQAAEDVVRELDAVAAAVTAEAPSSVRSTRGRRARVTDPLVVLPMLAAALAIVALGWVLTRERVERLPVSHARLLLDLPPEMSVGSGGAAGTSMAFSPDGASLAFRGGSPPRLVVRRLDDLVPRVLAGTELASNPQFSPDGRWIGFLRGSALQKIPVGGGPVTPIVDPAGRFAWAPDGSIVFARAVSGFLGALWRVSADGGVPQQITTPDSVLGGSHGSPTVLPDGKTVLFTTISVRGVPMLAAVRLGDSHVTALGVAGGSATYLPGGYLQFVRPDGSIAAARFDAKRLRVTSEPVVVLDSVDTKGGLVAEYAIAPNGTLAYLRGSVGTPLWELDRRGTPRVLIPTIQTYNGPRLSPDGQRLALTIGQPPYTSDVWIYDLESATLTRLTTDGMSSTPEWAPRGRRLAWSSVAPGREGVWSQPWDASTPPELLVPKGQAPRFTHGGDSLLATFTVANGTEVRIVPLPFAAGTPTRTVIAAPAGDAQPRLSPDGRWLAYVSEESGVRDVYIQPFPGPGGRFQISAGGGAAPMWAPSGRELFYRGGCCLIGATINALPEPRVVHRDTLFTMSATRSMYEVARDGSHFIMARLSSNTAAPVLVFGWGEEVRRRVAQAEKR